MVLIADEGGRLLDIPAAPSPPPVRTTDSATPRWPLPIGPTFAGKAAADALYSLATVHNIDPLAAAANALHEGANGAIGDTGTAFGPWQIHLLDGRISGADSRWLNRPEPNAWAWTEDGFSYAFRSMVAGGAQGLRGHAAVHAIVYGFERPGDKPGAERTREQEYDHLLSLGKGAPAYIAGLMHGPADWTGSQAPAPTPPASRRGEATVAADAWGQLRDGLGKTFAPAMERTATYADSLVALVTIPRR